MIHILLSHLLTQLFAHQDVKMEEHVYHQTHAHVQVDGWANHAQMVMY